MNMRSLMMLIESASTAPALDTIQDVSKAAKELGVSLELEEDGKEIHLTWIERTSGKKGAGLAAMDLLLAHADRFGKSIILVAKDDEPALVAYYMSFGFKSTDSLVEDGLVMIRRPRRTRK